LRLAESEEADAVANPDATTPPATTAARATMTGLLRRWDEAPDLAAVPFVLKALSRSLMAITSSVPENTLG